MPHSGVLEDRQYYTPLIRC